MAQEGFLYEENAYKALNKYKISTGGTAGASHDKPDLTIQAKGKKPTGCELKNSPTAAGSLVMKYYDGKWQFGDIGTDPEKEFLVDKIMDAHLSGPNYKGSDPIEEIVHDPFTLDMEITAAICLIQKNERGR